MGLINTKGLASAKTLGLFNMTGLEKHAKLFSGTFNHAYRALSAIEKASEKGVGVTTVEVAKYIGINKLTTGQLLAWLVKNELLAEVRCENMVGRPVYFYSKDSAIPKKGTDVETLKTTLEKLLKP